MHNIAVDKILVDIGNTRPQALNFNLQLIINHLCHYRCSQLCFTLLSWDYRKRERQRQTDRQTDRQTEYRKRNEKAREGEGGTHCSEGTSELTTTEFHDQSVCSSYQTSYPQLSHSSCSHGNRDNL